MSTLDFDVLIDRRLYKNHTPSLLPTNTATTLILGAEEVVHLLQRQICRLNIPPPSDGNKTEVNNSVDEVVLQSNSINSYRCDTTSET